ncbi:phasin family protein [Xanthobacter dioxanivorans]|uniref:Phasin family protein n=1 Tax=Xanthobacter dioxanivorans TaxID=2528964 RepID=A0A974PKV0_9HYPH|nr:phasin family protein [Xanthobacter dioxanivorans]QRG05443.1 phasin family protein [Xanthobacter dioxanivorans]
MTTKFGPDLELPAEMRAIAEKNVAQARQAFETLFTNAREAVGDTEGRLEEVRSGILDLRQKAIGLMEANVEASFDFLHKLVAAKSPQEMLSVQAEFLTTQMKSVAEQAKSFGTEAKSLGESAVRTFGEDARVLAERLKTLAATAAQNAQSAAQDFKSVSETAVRDAKTTAEHAATTAAQATDPNQSH